MSGTADLVLIVENNVLRRENSGMRLELVELRHKLHTKCANCAYRNENENQEQRPHSGYELPEPD